MPLSHNSDSSVNRGSYTPLQPRPEVRLSVLRKALRFLGFSQVKVLYEVIPKLPARTPSQELVSQKGLSDWSISATDPVRNLSSNAGKSRLVFNESEPSHIWNDINRQYLGFRANSKNLDRLYNDIVESKVACRPEESEDEYRDRVALTLVASGLADINDGALRGAHTLNRPFTQSQLMRLEENLERPWHELVLEVNAGKARAKARLEREIDRHPKLLMEVCTRTSFQRVEDLLFVSRHCHRYLVSGEGQDVLKAHGFPDAVNNRMGEVLPMLQPVRISADVLMQAGKFQRTCQTTDATDNAGKTINGIKFAVEKSEQDFNPESPEHRTLVMLQSLANCWLGYCEERIQAGLDGNNNEDDSTAERLVKAKRMLNDYWLAMSHRIMLTHKPFSTNFDSKNYQQVVLRRRGDKAVYWNSDSVQPRGDWFDSRSSEPVTLPK